MSDPGLAPRRVVDAPDGGADSGLHLRRWTMTTGSGSERAAGSRAAVVLAAGDSPYTGRHASI